MARRWTISTPHGAECSDAGCQHWCRNDERDSNPASASADAPTRGVPVRQRPSALAWPGGALPRNACAVYHSLDPAARLREITVPQQSDPAIALQIKPPSAAVDPLAGLEKLSDEVQALARTKTILQGNYNPPQSTPYGYGR